MTDLDPVYCMPASIIENMGLRKGWKALQRRASWFFHLQRSCIISIILLWRELGNWEEVARRPISHPDGKVVGLEGWLVVVHYELSFQCFYRWILESLRLLPLMTSTCLVLIATFGDMRYCPVFQVELDQMYTQVIWFQSIHWLSTKALNANKYCKATLLASPYLHHAL